MDSFKRLCGYYPDSKVIVLILILQDFEEYIQFTEYDSAHDGYHDWHIDTGGKELSSNRKLAYMSVQLSDPSDYEGQELQVVEKSNDVEERQGSAFIFPSYLLHRVSPCDKGISVLSCMCWICGRPHFR
jgi:PKHD-type hydroxylase